eukprot:SAG31_NODE_37250_length_306_cov_0.516908_2_plen_21_part_01
MNRVRHVAGKASSALRFIRGG